LDKIALWAIGTVFLVLMLSSETITAPRKSLRRQGVLGFSTVKESLAVEF